MGQVDPAMATSPLLAYNSKPIVVLVRSTNEPNLTIMLSPKQFDPLDLEIQLE